MGLYIPASERTTEMKGWIECQLAAAPSRDEKWTQELYQIYGHRLDLKVVENDKGPCGQGRGLVW